MLDSYIVLFPILLPILVGTAMLFMPQCKSRNIYLGMVTAVLLITGSLAAVCVAGNEISYTAFYLTDTIPIYFKVDNLGKLFAAIVTIVWILAGLFSFSYMEHMENEKRYWGFYLITYGILMGLDFSGNLVTMYLFYELMTLASMPLVLHTGSKEAIMAGLKYLFYSFFGAYMALFGVYFIYKLGNTIEFMPGGVFSPEVLASHQTILLIVVMLLLLGFGVKAGMFPLHAWLPTAHPVAPAPASAVLSGIIVKSGVLAIIRVVYYLFGPDFIRGTWVQTTWLVLILITIFMGSLLAFREPVLKKRLAYSTVSQISYILLGLAMMTQTSVTGSLLHVVAHAFIKVALFLCAGAIIHKTGKTRVDELTGIGKEMPVTMWCYTIVSLALIGIPPTSGFVSKWYLAVGSLDSGISVFAWLGVVVLLISALLTAGYLLPLTMKGFFPGADYAYDLLEKKEPSLYMTVPLLVFAGLTVAVGLLPNGLIQYITAVVETLL